MNRFAPAYRSTSVAIWLFAVACLVFAMVVVGGATRLTDSGLSITEWRPVTGAIPPLNQADWASEFAKYRQIPEYRQVNAGMSLEQFKTIYWWEWAHRLLGRLIGVAFAIPFLVFLAMGKLSRDVLARCLILLALGGLQGFIGWWMVSSGLADRVDVAPERLTIHLGLALIIFAMLIWTALDVLAGPNHTRPPRRWVRAGYALLALVYVQILLGGLVAGNDAGLVYNDWPAMNGAFLPEVDWSRGAWRAFLHDQALVQFNHRMTAYLLLIAATVFAVRAFRSPVEDVHKAIAVIVAVLVWIQAGIGIATLMTGVPIGLGVTHQVMAVLVLACTVWLAWTVQRSTVRIFSRSL
jgi:cytochrome c oxidase assembly protein subunit 15